MTKKYPSLYFPCEPQNIIDFLSDIIRDKHIVQLNYQDGHTIRYSYKDFLWDLNSQEYPLSIANEGNFSIYGYEEHHPETWLGHHRLTSITIANGWI